MTLWALYMAMSQALLAALVADTTPLALRGTGFGLFNFASGLALLGGNHVAGALWRTRGPTATFIAGAALAAGALIGVIPISRRRSL